MSNIKGKSKNYYRLLNLKNDASSHEILISYQKLITHWNNYIDKTPLAKERINDIKKAYEILSDPIKKNKYDKKVSKKSKINNKLSRSTKVENSLLESVFDSISMFNNIIPITTQIRVIDLTNNSRLNGPEIEIIK